MKLLFKISKTFYLLLVVGIFWGTSDKILAQEVEEEAFVRISSSDARSTALAKSNSSDISHSSISTLNPAGFSFIDKHSIAYNSFHSWSKNIYTMDLGYRSARLKRSSFMVNLEYLDTGLNEVNYLGRPELTEPDLERIQATIGYSYSPARVFSIGILAKGYTAWNDIKATEHINVDIGAIYAPTDALSYSLVLRGIGYGLGYDILGNGSTIIENRNIKETIEYGASLYFPDQTDRKILTLTASTEKVLREQGLYYRVGLEIIPISATALRFGYLNSRREQGFTYGVGINFSSFTLSYSVAPDSRIIDRAHQVELLINF